ncbi:allantoicase [compost metagenome]
MLSAVELQGNSHHYHEISNDQAFSHLRFNIYPDGGVARLRVYGVPFRDWSAIGDNEQVDLAAALNGGRALACSDEHFGRMSNILNPGRGINMGDGWETARRRTPGNDWVIVALGHAGEVEKVIVDTLHFKGNYPDSCSIQGAFVKGGTDSQMVAYPVNGQADVPASWVNSESPNPAPGYEGKTVGYPVSLQAINTSLQFDADNFAITDAQGASVNCLKVDSRSSGLSSAARGLAICTPVAPLASGQRYNVHVTGRLGSQPVDLSWSFTTR